MYIFGWTTMLSCVVSGFNVVLIENDCCIIKWNVRANHIYRIFSVLTIGLLSSLKSSLPNINRMVRLFCTVNFTLSHQIAYGFYAVPSLRMCSNLFGRNACKWRKRKRTKPVRQRFEWINYIMLWEINERYFNWIGFLYYGRIDCIAYVKSERWTLAHG